MTRLVHLSGELVAEQDAKISIFDSAIMLADTVTESTRTFHHTPFKLDEHIERLYLSLKLTRIDPQMSPARDEAHHARDARGQSARTTTRTRIAGSSTISRAVCRSPVPIRRGRWARPR